MTRLSQAVGHSLEDVLAFTHAGYWNRQRVWVRHNGIAGVWRIDRRTGQRAFTPISREAAPDYYGCVDGRFVAFDAKTTDHNARWRLDKERAHQYQLMLDLALAGAVCWFAIEQRSQQALHLLRIVPASPYPIVVFESLGLPDRLEIPWSDRAGGYDWLPLVRESWLR